MRECAGGKRARAVNSYMLCHWPLAQAPAKEVQRIESKHVLCEWVAWWGLIAGVKVCVRAHSPRAI
eukprot:1149081-Pelagomonas_calceolata.AAC.2